MLKPGERNLITDVDGILVGNCHDEVALTGTTVVLPTEPSVAAVDVRGGAPGTRETDALNPTCLVEKVDAVVLSGGSAFGLAAASGVAAWLAAAGRGFPVGAIRVPIVPAAILMDLNNGGDKSWGSAPPYYGFGERAAQAADAQFALGNIGAGSGAMAGGLKGGLGSCSAVAEDGLQVGALMAVNCVGSVVADAGGSLWAAPFEQQGEFGLGSSPSMPGRLGDLDMPLGGRLGGHTTIGVVATNLNLTKAEAQRVAIMAHDGMARAIRPVHTPLDGDSLFCLATGKIAHSSPTPHSISRVGMIAADCVSRAIGRAVCAAETVQDMMSYREQFR